MRNGPPAWLEQLGVATTALFASVGLVLLSIVALLGRQPRLHPAWVWLWGGFFLLLLLPSSIALDTPGLTFIATVLPVCLLASWSLQASRAGAAGGVTGALATMLVLFAIDFGASALTWQPAAHTSLAGTLRQLSTGVVESPGGTRSWKLPTPAPLPAPTSTLTLDARLAAGRPGSSWSLSTADISLTPSPQEGEAYVRARFPTGGDPYLMRSYQLEEPAAGRRFRARVQLRTEQPVPAQEGRGIWLQVWGAGGGASSLAVNVTRDWQTYTHEWSVPDSARSSTMRLILNDFDGLEIDIGSARLEVLRDGGWEELPPPAPLGMHLALDRSGEGDGSQASSRVIPGRDWQTYQLSLGPTELDSSSLGSTHLQSNGAVSSRLDLEPGLAVEVRNASLQTSDGSRAQPLPAWTRRSLWFGYPNSAGHVALVIGLAGVLTLASTPQAVIASVATLAAIAFTESRTAALAALIGLPALLLLRLRPGRALLLLGVYGAIAALALAALWFAKSPGLLEAVAGGPGLSRTVIWQVAWQGLRENPWTGVGAGPEAFSAYLAESYPQNFPQPIPNAHNIWLVFASEYGVFGLLAATWLTAGLLILAWRWGRWPGLAFIGPILLLNAFDYSLFSWWILFLVILGLNHLRDQASTRPQPQ